MAGRTIWKGSIHFESIHIPVKLHTAVKEQRIQFHLLHMRDHARLEQRMVCSNEEVIVPREEQVKGFEISKGQYVLVDPEELKGVEANGDRILEVREFVRGDQIDPRFFDRVYYLESERSLKSYSTLAEVLKETGWVGICTWTMRKRPYLGALQGYGKTLRLITLKFYDEVISVDSLGLPEASLVERELRAGRDLIHQLSGPFEPRQFANEHQKRVWELIERKARGEKVKILRPRKLKPTRPDELLKALEASLRKVA
jgi:DNA end-binding protein Ku